LELSIGTIVAGGAIFAYVRRIKNKLRARILRDYTCGRHLGDGGQQ
jgi:hypothetical protein